MMWRATRLARLGLTSLWIAAFAAGCDGDDGSDPSVLDTSANDTVLDASGSDTVLFPDAVADTSVTDTAVADTSVTDTAVADTSVTDTAVADTSVTDTAVADTSVADTSVTDTSVTDTADTANTADTADTDTSTAPTVDWCRLQWPLDVTIGAGTSLEVYGRVYVEGLTDQSAGNDLDADLVGRVGRGPTGSDPGSWTVWAEAAPTPGWDAAAAGEAANDEYVATLPAPGVAGVFDFAFQFSLDAGSTWLSCDRDAGDGADGSEDGYQAANAGKLSALADPCATNPCNSPPDSCEGDILKVHATPGVCSDDAGVAVCDYGDPSETDCADDGRECDPESFACVENRCSPNPCTTPPADECDGSDVVAFEAVGTCDDSTGEVLCTYAEASRTQCAETSTPYCGEGGCRSWLLVQPGDLAITEIMANPEAVGDTVGEWFEVKNVTSDALNLLGVELQDATSTVTTIDAALIVEPGAYLVFGNNADSATNGGVEVDWVVGFGLGNGGDEITLRRDGATIDFVDYGESGMNLSVPNGRSLQVGPGAEADNDLAASWCAAWKTSGEQGDYGSPGADNDPCGLEIGWCRLQHPSSVEVEATSDVDVFGRVWIDGVTDVDQAGNDPHVLVRAEVGLSPVDPSPDSDPATWRWSPAEQNPGYGPASPEFSANDDEWTASLTAPGVAGQYRYAFRVSGDRGVSWTYCDLDKTTEGGADGSDDGFAASDAGALTVTDPCSPNPCTATASSCGAGETYLAYTAAGLCVAVEGEASCDYAVFDTVDCAASDKVCFDDEGAMPASCVLKEGCTPDPCTEQPPNGCDGTEVVVYQAGGSCDESSGAAVCTHAEASRTQCAGTAAPFCSEGACQSWRLAVAGDLALTELMADPAGPDGDGEWFELKNIASDSVNLRGVRLHSGTASNLVDEDLIVAPGGYLVFGKNLDTATNGGVAVDWKVTLTLSNSGGDDLSVTRDEEVIDAITYTVKATSGVSLQLTPGAELDNHDEASWCEGYSPFGGAANFGTPGADNDPCALPIDWCRLQHPPAASVDPTTEVDVFGRVWIDGVTDQNLAGNDVHPLVRAAFGLSPIDATGASDPATWTWTTETRQNPEYGPTSPDFSANDDEWRDTLTAPAVPGAYRYAFRVSGDRGASWTYCDLDQTDSGGGDGSDDGFAVDDAGLMTIADPCEPDPCTATVGFCAVDAETYLTYTAACSVDNGQASCVYTEAGSVDCASEDKVCFDDGGASPASCISPCDLDPCTAQPGDACDGTEVVVYQAGGSCDDSTGEAVCTYAEASRSDCAGTEAPYCRDGACSVSRLAAPGDLAITEIMANPDGTDSLGEWFELGNISADTVDLVGLRLQDGSETFEDIDASLVVGPGEHLVFGRNADSATNGGVAVDWTVGFSLNNGGDILSVKAGEVVFDLVDYGSEGLGLSVSEGVSLQVAPGAELDNHLAASWCEGWQPFGTADNFGTPGTANACMAEVDPCDPNPCTATAGSCGAGETYPTYSEPGTCTADAGEASCAYTETGSVDCSETGLFCFDDEGAAPASCVFDPCRPTNPCTSPPDATCDANILTSYDAPGACSDANGDAVCDYGAGTEQDCAAGTTQPPDTCDGTELVVYEASGSCDDSGATAVCAHAEASRTDCAGTEAPFCRDGACSASRLAVPGDLAITEIMANPDGTDSQGEWFELRNISADTVDLVGLRLQDGSTTFEDIDASLVVGPGEHLVFGRNDNSETNGGVAVDWTFGFTLNNDADTLSVKAGEVVFDLVDYGPEGLDLSVSEGVSLQVAPGAELDNHLAASWCAGWQPYGAAENYGTPGTANTCSVSVDWCRLQHPATAELAPAGQLDVYGRLWIAGVTDADKTGNDPNPLVSAEIGLSPLGATTGSDPATWTWSVAAQNPDYGTGSPQFEENNDEWTATLSAPGVAGAYRYAFRVSGDLGQSWTYCDLDKSDDGGSDGSVDGFAVLDAGLMTVTGAGCVDDTFGEPNDSQGAPKALTGDTNQAGLVICADNEDWFSVDVEEGTTIDLLIEFTHADGDLSLVLYDPSDSEVASSATASDDEDLSYTVPAGQGGTYTFVVDAAAGIENTYELTLVLTDDPCLPNPCTAPPSPSCEGAVLTTPPSVGTCSGAGVCDYVSDQTQETCSLTCIDGACAGVEDLLFMSEYVEGSSNNKAIEIYNRGNTTVDLAALGCELHFYGTTDSHTTVTTNISLTGTVPPGGTWVVCDNDSLQVIKDVCDQQSTSAFFNGDDPIELYCGTGSVDWMGQTGVQISFGTNHTYRRKCEVHQGDTVGDDAFVLTDEWDEFAQDTFDGLGSHTICDP